jgi:hypothetical protein
MSDDDLSRIQKQINESSRRARLHILGEWEDTARVSHWGFIWTEFENISWEKPDFLNAALYGFQLFRQVITLALCVPLISGPLANAILSPS